MTKSLPEIQSFARIKVIGVGGSGKGAINHMITSNLKGIDFIAMNTDTQDLHNCLASKKIHLGKNLTKGLGAGMDPEIGRRSAEETKEEIQDVVKGADIIFIACGMGGGTATGAAPVIAKAAKEEGILTVAIVTKPFFFEGQKRTAIAEAGLLELEKEVDALIVVPNDRLLSIIDRNMSVRDAFKMVKQIQPIVDKINQLEQTVAELSNELLKSKTVEFKERLQKGESLDSLLPEAFAVVREVSKRLTGMRHFDVQLMGGIFLHKGNIAEMHTGEGKTLTATLPLYLNALTGKGVHLVTVNDYLAKRDAVWMGQIYDFLGLSVGVIQNQLVSYRYNPHKKNIDLSEGSSEDKKRDENGVFKVEYDYLDACPRKDVYKCDIVYGTNNEFGFDYLRDNMVQSLSEVSQRTLHFAIVDEVDSILIDEARTPLIISAPAEEAAEMYYKFADLVSRLQENDDYNIDEKMHASTLTESGIKKIEQWLGVENIYVEGGIVMVHHVEQALKAKALFKRDRDYVVEQGEVIIVDEFTGRKMPGRRYSEGLHQAIEAKERVAIQRESRTMATITFQNYFRMYEKLSGMTGTAVTEAEEFGKIYKLEVVVVPSHRPKNRLDKSDKIYKTQAGKFRAIAKEVKTLQQKGQPVLIGTVSVEKNEFLAMFLEQEGVKYEILNAKNHEREGEIIAQAGKPGAVTLATNMAGRGVDIILGGNPPVLEDGQKVRDLGGLYVLGTERHESRRIDNQLRGRAGRQGDPGETQFYLSTEDDLMRIFAGDRIKSVMQTLGVGDDMPIEQKTITRIIESARTCCSSRRLMPETCC
jgi:preprotein translocase subunit SecA